MKKFLLVLEGQPAYCPTHGWHTNWRVHTNNNAQCRKCACDIQKRSREQNPLKHMLKDAKQHAKKKNREFCITLEDLQEQLTKQDNKCALSGISFSPSIKPSLDRIDSSKGYTKNNIQFLLNEVNIMKSNFQQEDFTKLCIAISDASEAKMAKMAKKGKRK